MIVIARKAALTLLRFISRHPRLKRLLVDAIYRLPALDALLRSATRRTTHLQARIDVDAQHLPEGSRRSFNRIRARMPD